MSRLLNLITLAAIAFGCVQCTEDLHRLLSDNDPPAPAQYVPRAIIADKPVSQTISSCLARLGEPVMSGVYPAETAIRFAIVSWGQQSLAVRADIRNANAATVNYKIAKSGHCGDAPGTSLTSAAKPLGKDDIKSLSAFVKNSGFWTYKPDTDLVSPDGDIWFVEVREGNRYRAIYAWNPERGPIVDIGTRLLRAAGNPAVIKP